MNITSIADSPIVFAVAFASWRRLLLLRRRGGTAAVSSVNIYRIVVYTWAMKLDRINIICTFNIKFVSIHRATCVGALLLLLLSLSLLFINDSINGAPCCIAIQMMFIIIIISIIISIIWILLLLADIEYKSSFIAAGIAFAATNARFTDNFSISHWIPRDMVTIALQFKCKTQTDVIRNVIEWIWH